MTDFIKVENQSDEEIEIQTPVFGYHVSVDKKMFVLSDDPPEEIWSSTFKTYIANPGDHDWKSRLFIIGMSMGYSGTHFLCWAKGAEDALEIAAEAALEAGMKGFFTSDEEMAELYDEARAELGPDADDEEVQQQAEADLTYTESGWITAYEWSIDDVNPGAAFGKGQDLYTAAKFVCEAYTDDSDEARFELVPNANRARRQTPPSRSKSAQCDDYIISVPRMSAQRRFVYEYCADNDGWGSMIGLARGFDDERSAFDWCQSHAFQRGKQSASVFREKHGGDVVQLGHVGEAHRGGSYQPNARLGDLPAKSTASIDHHAATELELYIENDYALVGADNSKGKMIEKNLDKKIKQGKYDFSLSVKLWEYLIEDGAKKYAEEMADAKDWYRIFSPATRRYVAERFAHDFAQQRGVMSQNGHGAKPETFEACVYGHRGNLIWKSDPNTSYKALMAQADSQSPDGSVTIRGEYTSDGTHWQNHGGRVLAQRINGEWLVG